MMRTEFFSVANGDREDVPDVTIILTDGVSNLATEKNSVRIILKPPYVFVLPYLYGISSIASIISCEVL
jgi:hypothetical protein